MTAHVRKAYNKALARAPVYSGDAILAQWVEGGWYPAFDENSIECEPTHWQPLPAPPKDEK